MRPRVLSLGSRERRGRSRGAAAAIEPTGGRPEPAPAALPRTGGSAMTATLADPVAFRTVFAAPGEKLVLALVDRDQGDALRSLADGVRTLRKGGVGVKLTVYGDSSALLPGYDDVGFVEPWAKSLLPSLL